MLHVALQKKFHVSVLFSFPHCIMSLLFLSLSAPLCALPLFFVSFDISALDMQRLGLLNRLLGRNTRFYSVQSAHFPVQSRHTFSTTIRRNNSAPQGSNTDDFKNHTPSSKKINIESCKFYVGTKKGLIKVNTEAIRNEVDLKAANEEYISLMKSGEERHKLTCKSCGKAPLQSTDKTLDNYYKIPQISLRLPPNDTFPKSITHGDYLKMAGIVEPANDLASEYDVMFANKVKEFSEVANYHVECLRCHELRKHGKYDISPYHLTEILEKIPKDGTILNVVSILDFPLSCDKNILNGRDPKSIYYAVTMADLFYRKEVQIDRTGLQYVKDVLAEYMDADPAKVFFVSSLKSWDIGELDKCLPAGDVYFVGRANVGKSSLIKALVAHRHGISMDQTVVKKMEKKDQNYLQKVGLDAPGSFHVPGFTREFTKYIISDKYTVVDTPGFFPEGMGIYQHMTPETIRQKPKFKYFVAEDLRRYLSPNFKGPKIYDGKDLYSYGGFFYLQPPKNVVFKRALAFNKGEEKQEVRYGRMQRAEEINLTRPVEIGKRYAVNKEAFEKLERYVIPPFFGTIDIVVQDLGFISIQPTSSPSATNGLFQIWVPAGVKVIIRECIFQYMYRVRDAYDETGNRLKKKNIPKRGASVLKRITEEGKLHFSELVPVTADLPVDEAFKLVCPVDDMIITPEKQKKFAWEGFPNQYWRKLRL